MPTRAILNQADPPQAERAPKVQRHWLSLVLIVLASLPWSFTLGMVGIWLIDHRGEGVFERPVVALSAGVAALCGAQLVFLYCIADRLFPNAHRRLVRGIEGGLGAVFLGSVLVLSSASLWGSSGG